MVDCEGAPQILLAVLMAYPDQARSLQGSQGVSLDILVVNDLGTGSGWQQSKQNQALLAVVGTCARTECKNPCVAELT